MAVNLIVGTNSYGTLAEANAYLDESARWADTWVGYGDDAKRRALISAFRRMEQRAASGTNAALSTLATVAVAAGGTGYAVNDELTLAGGTSTQAAKVTVAAVSGGVVTSVTIADVGLYSVAPSSPASTTGGGGSSCTLTVTFQDQTSDFPRTGLTDCQGDAVAGDEYPADLKSGQFEYAAEIAADVEVEAAIGTGSNVKAVGAGSARVEFFRQTAGSSSAQNTLFPASVERLVGCFYESSVGIGSGGTWTESDTTANNASCLADGDAYEITE